MNTTVAGVGGGRPDSHREVRRRPLAGVRQKAPSWTRRPLAGGGRQDFHSWTRKKTTGLRRQIKDSELEEERIRPKFLSCRMKAEDHLLEVEVKGLII